MTRTSPTVQADAARDAMREPRGVVAGILWAATWIAAIVAIAVTGVSAASALRLTGVPDPGAVSVSIIFQGLSEWANRQ